jgi:predicted phosphoadenosine phosphosulfate sulfurtransferase
MTWRLRCYSEGIPDEVLPKVAKSMRAPSYKAVAVAILRNDHNLHSIGFVERESDLSQNLIRSRRSEKSPQGEIF